MSETHKMTGFGFGPIQAGLFVHEAVRSGAFSRIVIAEIDPTLVEAVRSNNGCYRINIALRNGIASEDVQGIEILNPLVPEDRTSLLSALNESTDVTTCLPSISAYAIGGNTSVADLLARGLAEGTAPSTIVYTAENNNHAGEHLEQQVTTAGRGTTSRSVQYLNTVIGKMSRVVTDPDEIAELRLHPITPGLKKAFLVESFNRILVSRIRIPGVTPGIRSFDEKDDLLPFEEAKLYGHNAVHALLAYVGELRGHKTVASISADDTVIEIARSAFLNESGAALRIKFGHIGEPLFTEAGYAAYVDDLMERITNPFLQDSIQRAGRDVLRKLAPDDRLFGTMRLALENGIEPSNMAMGTMAAIAVLMRRDEAREVPASLRRGDWRNWSDADIEVLVKWLWRASRVPPAQRLIQCVQQAKPRLLNLLARA